MDERTLKALKGSIAKWKGIVAGTCVDLGCQNCPLCQLFHENCDCKGCPVSEKTGRSLCDGTPYQSYDPDDDDLGLAAAEREVEFLKSLLPAEEAV